MGWLILTLEDELFSELLRFLIGGTDDVIKGKGHGNLSFSGHEKPIRIIQIVRQNACLNLYLVRLRLLNI